LQSVRHLDSLAYIVEADERMLDARTADSTKMIVVNTRTRRPMMSAPDAECIVQPWPAPSSTGIITRN
jgi:hypothetical protein